MFDLTREQKIEAFTMRIDGYTYDEIGAKLGMSKQNVHKWMLSVFVNQTSGLKKLSIRQLKIGFALTGLISASWQKRPASRISILSLFYTGKGSLGSRS